MIDTIVIDFSDPTASIRWASFADGLQQEIGNVDSLSEIAELARNHTLIVWISGEKVTLSTVTVPAGQQRHLQQILPALLEDSLAADIDFLHFSTGNISAEGQVNVAIIERAELEKYLELFADGDLIPNYVLIDSLAVPWLNNTWTLQIEGDLSRLRTDEQIGYVLDTQNLPLLLPMLSSATSQALSLYVSENQKDSLPLNLEYDWCGEPVDKLAQLPEKSVMALNLLQGEFKSRSNVQKYWLQWHNVVYLALAALLIQLTSVGLETWQLNQQVKQYKAEVEAVFKSAFPDENRLINPKAQMTQRLAKLQSQQDNSGFLMLLQQIAPALQQSKLVSLSRINFEQRLGELRLDVNTEDYAQLETLKNAIAKLALNVELGTVSGNKGAYTAKIMIRGQQQ